jgi:DNA-binding LytR/AlgR family response regulator
MTDPSKTSIRGHALSDRGPREPSTKNPTARFHIRRTPPLDVRAILIVEDELLIAADLEAQIREDGGRDARIALSIEAACEELTRARDLAGVILDVKVGGTTSFGLADALTQAGLPFVFFTGYRSLAIPDRFVGVPRIAKPANWRDLKQALATARERILHTGLGSFRESVEAALPALRNRARRISRSAEEADLLVERTLEHAISMVGGRSLRVTIEDWLLSLLEMANSQSGGRILH